MILIGTNYYVHALYIKWEISSVLMYLILSFCQEKKKIRNEKEIIWQEKHIFLL